jgi:squalene/oxidosqualene cyclase-like protein
VPPGEAGLSGRFVGDRWRTDDFRPEIRVNDVSPLGKRTADVASVQDTQNGSVTGNSSARPVASRGGAANPSWAAAALRGTARLMAHQDAAGRWEGEVVWCPVITAQVVLAYAIMRRSIAPERGQLILRHFARTRRPDGGWGLHPESHSYLFVTTLVYVASRLLGAQPDSPLLGDAVAWLTRHNQGLGALPTWGRFWLSLLGLYDRSRITLCPPELFLLPGWMPIAADRLYCHTRSIYLGMAYLSGVGLQADLGTIGAALRQELAAFTAPNPQPRHLIAATDLYVPPGRGLRLTYDAMATLGPLWRRLPGAAALRRRALDRCLQRIRAAQHASNFQALSPVNGILNTLALWTHDPGAPEVQASIAGLDAWCWQDPTDGLRYAGARSTTWDTAFAVQALAAAPQGPAEHDVAIRSGHAALAALQLTKAPAALDEDRQNPVGGWCFGEPTHGWSVSDCTAEAISALLLAEQRMRNATQDTSPPAAGTDPLRAQAAQGEAENRSPSPACLVPRAKNLAAARLADAVGFLLARQNPDGGFATYERRRGGKWLERLNPSEMFGSCMTERSYIECTASAIRALRHVADRTLDTMTASAQADAGRGEWAQAQRLHAEPVQAQCARAMTRARDFLLTRQRPDGAWPGFWGINFIYATWFAVTALRDAGLPTDHAAVRRAVDWLVSVQHPDGGWGEHFTGCLTESYVPSTRSLVVMTSWAVLGLLHADDRISPAARRGLDWLVQHQLPDGDWPRDSVNGVFFGTAMLDYRLYNSYFPLWALNVADAMAR